LSYFCGFSRRFFTLKFQTSVLCYVTYVILVITFIECMSLHLLNFVYVFKITEKVSRLSTLRVIVNSLHLRYCMPREGILWFATDRSASMDINYCCVSFNDIKWLGHDESYNCIAIMLWINFNKVVLGLPHTVMDEQRCSVCSVF
jgi:hypothetical protein